MGDKLDKALDFFNKGSDIIDDSLSIVSEAVEDKDKRNEFIYKMAQLKTEVQKVAVTVTTIPFMDGLYKLGSHISSWMTIIMVGIGVACGHTWTWEEIGGLLGCNGIYQSRKAFQKKVEAQS